MRLRGAYNCGLTAALALLLCACGRPGTPGSLPTDSFRQRITAEWLARQPGTTAGDFGFHLLDADNHPLPWRGLSIAPAGDVMVVSAIGDPPPDAYLYVAYDYANHALDVAELDPSRTADYLLVTVPGRIPGVLPVGLARMASARDRELAPGPLLRLRFSAGSERAFRGVSSVSDDPGTAAVLQLGPAGSGMVELSWDERNLGDYNNNSEVGISDLTPLGAAFLQQVNGDPKLLLVDGDENGELNIADVSKIGRNFGTTIDGYALYRAAGASPGPGSFAIVGGLPTVARADVLAATDPALRQQRLHYAYSAAFNAGTLNSYYVQAWSATGPNNLGPQSNTVAYDAPVGNLPPVWKSTIGLTSATGLTNGLRLTFGRATDPEGSAVSYLLRYVPGGGAIGSPGTVELSLPPPASSGDPPYTYDLLGLAPGEQYTLLLVAVDDVGTRSTNTQTLPGQVPLLGNSPHPWSTTRCNSQRTGSNSAFDDTQPLELLWNANYDLAGSFGSYPVVKQDGQGFVVGSSGTIRHFSTLDGSLLPDLPADAYFFLTLGTDKLAFGETTATGLYDLPSGQLDNFDAPAFETLLLGDYLISIGDYITAFDTNSASELWRFAPVPGADVGRLPCTDGHFLYNVASNGRLDKIDLITGDSVDFIDLGADAYNVISLAFDQPHNVLYAADDVDLLIAIDPADLSITRRVGTGFNHNFDPVLIQQNTPPLLITQNTEGNGDWQLYAYSLLDQSLQWTVTGTTSEISLQHLSAGASRIFLCADSHVYSYDFKGRLRQTIDVPEDTTSDPVLAGDRLLLTAGNSMYAYKATTTDLPPTWQGTSAKPGGGIRTISAAVSGEVTVDWDYASDDHGAPVRYALYWRVDSPPDFDTPTAETHIIADIMDTGQGDLSHSYTFSPGVPGRIYAGLRAYDAPWDDNPKIDPNTNWLGVTPGWGREDFVLGGSEPDDLPAGNVYFMRGYCGPGDYKLHLVYNDESTLKLTYLTNSTGSWTYDAAGLDAYPCNAFDITVRDQLKTIAICDGTVSILTASGANWARTQISGAVPVTNPAVSVTCMPYDFYEGFLAYTHFAGGTFPNLDVDYFTSASDIGNTWSTASLAEPTNFSARDIDALYDGFEWVAFQRGYEYAPNRLTPQRGSLHIAQNSGSPWNISDIDAGVVADADCGKRVQLAEDADGGLHLAYLDLQTSDALPRGQLKYAFNDGTGWQIRTLQTFDLSFQPGSTQFTWGELGLAIVNGHDPAIGILQRNSGPNGSLPHLATAGVWKRNAGVWGVTKLNDGEFVFPSDREPCVLLADGDGKLHLFFATTSDPTAQPPVCDMISHLYEQ